MIMYHISHAAWQVIRSRYYEIHTVAMIFEIGVIQGHEELIFHTPHVTCHIWQILKDLVYVIPMGHLLRT